MSPDPMVLSLDLSAIEHGLLLDLLRDELGRLKGEIYRTEARAFKDELKARETVLVSLIARLEAARA
jgi:hypothetical protein